MTFGKLSRDAELIETAKGKPQKTANLWIIWRSRMSGDRDLTEWSLQRFS
ncbi:hypothetical protein [Microcystis aeruginosa]|jgi:hypothetical protein|nr:hypothetical protein [Microcystis aeruginosa]MDB9395308.1 hypothetical protein [Microcystis aeruginosa CS-573]